MKKVLNMLVVSIGLSLVVLPLAYAETIKDENIETTSQYVDSSAITAKVKSVLLAKKGVDSTKISVQSEAAADGQIVVILTGTQPSTAQINLAGLTAMNVKGVAKVVNKLTVAR